MSSPVDNRRRGDGAGRFLDLLSRFAMVGVLALLLLVFSILKPQSFGTVDNYRSIANQQATVVFLALAVMIPLIVGEFDFSVGATFSLSQTLCAYLILLHGWNVAAAILVALLASLAAGMLNAFTVVKLGFGSFVATLASSSLIGGISLLISGGQTIFGNAPKSLLNLAQKSLLGVPLPIYYAAIVVIAITALLTSFPVGRRMYATGSNVRAAALTGIRTDRLRAMSFLSSSLLAGLGGVLLAASLGAASNDSGGSLLITALSAAFLGATAITPGRFNVLGTVIAVYVVAVAISGLQQFGAQLWVTPVFEGSVLLVAVGLALWSTKVRALRATAARLRMLNQHAAEDHDFDDILAAS